MIGTYGEGPQARSEECDSMPPAATIVPMRFLFHDPRATPSPVVSVDGVAPLGPNFSHWPGHRTPDDLRHDLSTGSALRLAALSDDERRERFEGLETVTNTHYDTDGVLSVFAVLHPERALAHGDALLAAAATGDFQVFTTEEALATDLVLAAVPGLTPDSITDPIERRQHQYEAALALVPALLDDAVGALGPLRTDFDRILEDLRWVRDEAEPARVDPETGLAVVTSPRPLDRIALHLAAGDRFRVLAVVPFGTGHLFRYHDRVESWFDLVSVTPPPRVPLGPLAEFLEALEVSETEPHWMAHPADAPVPECWFGEPGSGRSFGPYATGELCVSRLTPRLVERAVTDHLARGTTVRHRLRGE